MARWVSWRGEESKRLARRASLAALRATAVEILDGSASEVPLKDGDLLASGKIKSSRAKVPTVRIVYGGPSAPYAVKWHEGYARFRGGRNRRYLANPYNRLARRRHPVHYRREMARVGFRLGGFARRVGSGR